ncbi:MAG: hypothetical protein JKY03_12565 [Aureispira sp.]|nr:hypothetical protein [Aureispira sp.]
MDKPSNNTKTGILILVIVLVLFGGGFAAWKILGTKEEELPPPTEEQEQEQLPPVTGRRDASSEENKVLTEDLVKKLLGQNEPNPDNPAPTAVLQSSKEGQLLIEERTRNIQLSEGAADSVRAIYHVGRTLVDTSSWTNKAISAISGMFAQLHNVEKDNYLTYPIFGKYETKGAPLRAELQRFLDQSWEGYNVTNKRHSGSAHWIGQLSLNLIYGSQNSYVHTEDEIWWLNQGQSVRDGLDFYKAVNGHDVGDRRLLKKVQDRPVYNAGVMYAFVQSWMKEMDYFDAVTEQTAIAGLIGEGYLMKTTSGKGGATKTNGNN